MLKINNCACDVTNVNQRKENHGNSKEPAFDMSFHLVVHAECIKGLYSNEFIRAMWKPEGKALTVEGITLMTISNEFTDGKVTIKEGTGHETIYNNCKIKDFKLRPRELQMIEVWFKIQYQASNEDEVVPAFRCLKHEGVQITIEANDPDPTKNKKTGKDSQVDAFPNGEPEEDESPFKGSDLEGDADDPVEEGDTAGNGFDDFVDGLE